jgi:Trypsin-like peptidase domain
MQSIISKTLAVFVLLMVPSISCMASQEISNININLPILIVCSDNSSGTGFYIHTGNEEFLVTARHVLFDNASTIRCDTATLISYSNDNNRQIVKLDLKKLEEAGHIKTHKTHDVAVLHLGSLKSDKNNPGRGTPIYFKGVDDETKSGSIIVVKPPAGTRPFDHVLVSNDVFIFGYPIALSLSGQFEPDRPLLRKGVIAGKNNLNNTIIIDCPSYPGNSGGPVIMVDDIGRTKKFLVIGIVTQFIPLVEQWRSSLYPDLPPHITLSNSGYAVVEPMDYIMELINSFKD